MILTKRVWTLGTFKEAPHARTCQKYARCRERHHFPILKPLTAFACSCMNSIRWKIYPLENRTDMAKAYWRFLDSFPISQFFLMFCLNLCLNGVRGFFGLFSIWMEVAVTETAIEDVKWDGEALFEWSSTRSVQSFCQKWLLPQIFAGANPLKNCRRRRRLCRWNRGKRKCDAVVLNLALAFLEFVPVQERSGSGAWGSKVHEVGGNHQWKVIASDRSNYVKSDSWKKPIIDGR